MDKAPYYAVGQQNFRALREDGCVYVDKTQFLAKIVDSKIRYWFLARPRRFGKSLFLSTLEYFFKGKSYKTGEYDELLNATEMANVSVHSRRNSPRKDMVCK